jgi:hypothetical protein
MSELHTQSRLAAAALVVCTLALLTKMDLTVATLFFQPSPQRVVVVEVLLAFLDQVVALAVEVQAPQQVLAMVGLVLQIKVLMGVMEAPTVQVVVEVVALVRLELLETIPLET